MDGRTVRSGKRLMTRAILRGLRSLRGRRHPVRLNCHPLLALPDIESITKH